MTAREKAIEQAKIYRIKIFKGTSVPKLMADFAISYSEEREREAFEAGHQILEFSGSFEQFWAYPTFEDYQKSKIEFKEQEGK